MIEYATAVAGKATIMSSLDTITGLIEILGPVNGEFKCAQMGYATPFHVAGITNALARLPLALTIRRRVALRSASTVTWAADV